GPRRRQWRQRRREILGAAAGILIATFSSPFDSGELKTALKQIGSGKVVAARTRIKNKNPACAGFCHRKSDRGDSDRKRVFLVFRASLRFGFRRLHRFYLLLGLSFLLFFFGQLCPVQGFELKAHGAPPSSE
ncbi:MAG: hypothetical protein ACREVZ_02925, partial [Burkholderiales bacterium]